MNLLCVLDEDSVNYGITSIYSIYWSFFSFRHNANFYWYQYISKYHLIHSFFFMYHFTMGICQQFLQNHIRDFLKYVKIITYMFGPTLSWSKSCSSDELTYRMPGSPSTFYHGSVFQRHFGNILFYEKLDMVLVGCSGLNVLQWLCFYKL